MSTTSVLLSDKRTETLRVKFNAIDVSDDMKVFQYARQGLKPGLFYDFAEAINISNKSLADLINISSRTISNYKEQKKLLEPVYGEHLLKLIGLYKKGVELFGSVDEFSYWLNKPFWNSKERPMDWLTTPGGVDLVADELIKMAYGDAV
ncbi:antitoxin Xre-like helix-turn-helix domain-containing protein [Pedobacter lusitanus]|uniref:antitoxin Xre-like helix-turn-helix domain-containing protein n=1 Tax=Pedobacter lusitanus TaxID=1503925 RepID=UPI00069620A3|nr:antitoxin Xre-like helix-turn-helix domain-containing protein [Pedobacter lusitanus]